MQMDVRQNLQLYKDMIQCAGPLYLWAYNDCGRLVYSNCPRKKFWHRYLSCSAAKSGCMTTFCPIRPCRLPPPSACSGVLRQKRTAAR